MNRALAIIALLIFTLYLVLGLRRCAMSENTPASVCTALCDQRGRELASFRVKTITVDCLCGKTKKVKTLNKP